MRKYNLLYFALYLFFISVFGSNIYGQTADNSIESEEAISFFKKAAKFHQSKDYEKAVENAERLIEILEKTALNSYQLGMAYFYKGFALENSNKKSEAVEPLEKAYAILNENPKTTDSLRIHLNFSLATVLSDDLTGREKESVPLFQKVLDMTEGDTSRQAQMMRGRTFLNYAGASDNLFEIQEGIERVDECLKIYKKLLPENHASIGKAYNTKGNLKNKVGDYSGAVLEYKKSLKIFKASESRDDFYVGASSHNLAGLLRRQGKISEGLDFYLIAKPIFEKKLGLNHYYTLANLSSIAYCYYLLDQPEKGIELDEALLKRLIDTNGENHEEVIGHLLDMGNSIQIFLKDDERAAAYFERAIRLSEVNNKMTGRIAGGMVSYGHSFIDSDEKKAKFFIEKGIRALEDLNADEEVQSIIEYEAATEFYTQIGDLEMALKHTRILDRFISEESWEKENFGTMPSPGLVIGLLSQKGNCFLQLYEKNPEKRLLDSADLALNRALKIYDYWIGQYSEESSQFWLQGTGKQLFEYLINREILQSETSKDPTANNRIFKLMEHARASVLMRSIQQSDAQKFAGVPDDLVTAERKFKEEILHTEQEIFYESQAGDEADSDYLNFLNKSLIKKRAEQRTLNNQLKNDYPNYFLLKNMPEPIDLKMVQNRLSKDQAILEFFVGTNQIFILAIQKTGSQHFKLPIDFPLRKTVTDWHQLLLKNQSNKLPKLIEESHFLYKKLLMKLFEKEELPFELTIIPDDILFYLPFELLVKNVGKKSSSAKNIEWLLKDHAMSYNHSTGLWLKNKSQKSSISGWAGFAPEFKTKTPKDLPLIAARRNLGQLFFNQKEVEKIAEIAGGKSFLNAAAGKNDFLKNAPNFGVLHIASHAKIEDSNHAGAFLAFAPDSLAKDNGRLYLNELYALDLPAQLVVLSACETGLGKLKTGEGMLSLARGFTYAGAKSLVNSLWSVNDRSTSEIMISFYENLKKGMEKDAALRQAKLTYLDNHPGKESNPFYWAGFVSYGDQSQINFGNRNYLWQVLLVILFVGLAFYFFKNNKAST